MIVFADYEAIKSNNTNDKPYYLHKYDCKEYVLPLVLSFTYKNDSINYYSRIGSKLGNSYNNNNNNVSFIAMLDYLIKINKGVDTKIYFHNLKFDWDIIRWELNEHDIYQKIDIDNERITYQTDSDFIHNTNSNYYINMGKDNFTTSGYKLRYKNVNFTIADTYKILAMAQDKILKAFNYPLKPSIDFETFDYNSYKQMEELIERCNYDVSSLQQVFRNVFGMVKNELGVNTVITASSLAYSSMVKKVEGVEELQPQLTEEEYIYNRRSYNGGVTTLGIDTIPNHIYENIFELDINKSYASELAKKLPYGHGKPSNKYDIDKYFGVYLAYVSFDFGHKTPFIRVHSNSSATFDAIKVVTEVKYKKHYMPSKFSGYLYINSVDIDLINRHAVKSKINIIRGYIYRLKPYLKNFITSVSNEVIKAKKNGHYGIEQIYKLIQNSLYGKHAQNLTGIVDVIGKDFSKQQVYSIDNAPFYIPVANYVVSMGRKNFVDTMNIIGGDFLYGDTDSVYFKNKETVLPLLHDRIDNFVLGKWSADYDIIHRAKFLGRKMYMLDVTSNGNRYNVIKSVGMNSSASVTKHSSGSDIDFANYYIGSSFVTKKMKSIVGGKAMETIEYTIKERFKE
jgi:hypothetical protein